MSANFTSVPATTDVAVSWSTRLANTDSTVSFFTHWESLFYMAWIPIVIFIARYTFSIPFWIRDRGFHLRDELTTRDNKAIAAAMFGYYLAIGLILQGAMSEPVPTLVGRNIYTTVAWTGIGLVYLFASVKLNDLLLHLKIDYQQEIIENKNLAVGLVNGAVYLSSGIIARFTISGNVANWGEALLSSVILWFMSQIFFIFFIHVYDFVTVDVDEQEELLQQNLAVGVSVSMGLVACAIVLSSPVEKSESVVALCIWFALAVVILMGFKLIGRVLIAPNALTSASAGYKPNPGVSAVEGGVLILAGHALRALITFRGCAVDKRGWSQRIVDVEFAMSIFSYYNIAYPFCIAAFLVVARGLFSLPHLIKNAGKMGLWDAWCSFLNKLPEDDSAPLGSGGSAPAATAGEGEMKPVSARPSPAVVVPDPGAAPAAPVPAAVASAEAAIPTDFVPESPYSAPRGIAFTGYLLGCSFVVRGAIASSLDSTAPAQEVLAYGIMWLLVGMAMLAICNLITMTFLWGRLNAAKLQTSAAFVEAATYMSTGYNVGACLLAYQGQQRDPSGRAFNWGEDIGTVIVFSLMQQGMLVIIGKAYQIVTPYDDQLEVKRGNLAAGVSSGLMWLAIGVITATPIQRDEGAALFFAYVCLAALYLFFFRYFVDKFVLIGAELAKEVETDENYGASMVEGSTAIACALALSTFVWQPCVNGVNV